MAQLVLGAGSSHGPTIKTPPAGWDRLGERDQQDPRFDYRMALRMVRPGMEAEIAIEKRQERYDACQAAVKSLGEVIRTTAPDALVVVSNPHSVLPDDPQPVFGVYCGATVPVPERSGEPTVPPIPRLDGVVRTERPPRKVTQKPAHPELAEHLLTSLITEEFDVALATQFPATIALEDAYSIVYDLYLTDQDIPMVPIILSRYLPHQATPRRCYGLGQALRRAIASWQSDKRVAILASGGLSHQIIDEELDKMVIDALAEGNGAQLCSLSRERLNRAPGTPEILNWVTVAGAMAPGGMTLVDYVPCYRSLAGTGHGVTFGYWS